MKNILLVVVVMIALSSCKFEGHHVGSNVKSFVSKGQDMILYGEINIHDTIPICQLRHVSNGEKNWEVNYDGYKVGDTIKDIQMPFNTKLWYVVDSLDLFVVE